VASLKRVPRLKDQIITVKQVERGETVYVCKVVDTDNYYRFSELQYGLLKLFDGNRTLEEMAEEFNASTDSFYVDVEFLESFVDNIKELDIVEHSPEEKKALLLERIRDERRRKTSSINTFGNVLDIKLSAWNPNRYFERIHPYFRFLYTPSAIVASVVCILGMLALWISEWERMKAGTIDLFNFANKTGVDVLQFFIILFVVSFVHESAHGLTCKHFGGTVPSMGFMIIYFTPCFFVDVTDAFLFDRHYKRQWTIFAGGYIELVMCSFATLVWVLTSPGTLVNDVAYKTLLMTGLLSVIINYNPLLKLDGYYALMDYLEIADLWESSFDYTGNWIKKTIFRLPVDLDERPPSVRRILIGYCLTSVAYKVVIITVFLLFLKNILFGLLGIGGYLVLGLAVYFAVKSPLLKLAGFLKFFLLDKKEVLMTRRSLLIIGAASAVTVGLLTLLPIPVVVRGQCSLEPATTAIIRPSIDGRIEELFVEEGRRVAAGDALAVLRNDALALALPAIEGRIELCEAEIAEAGDRGESTVLVRKLREREFLIEERRTLAEKSDALTLRAPMDGVITTPRLQERIGSFLNAGQSFVEIAGPGPAIVRVPIREYRMDEVVPGQTVELNFVSHSFTTYRGRVTAVAPAPMPSGPPAVEVHEPIPIAASLSLPADPLRPEGAGLDPGQEFTDFEVIVALEGDLDGLCRAQGGS
jgi:putative peptide zinc metalloprotease protein